MLLAAGRGRRMGALTRHRPKPLLPLAGEPLIVHHLRALAAAGVTRVVINLSWHGDRLRAALGDRGPGGTALVYSDEGPEPLETAGGIVRALPLLGDAPFVLVNADVATDHPLTPLWRGADVRTALGGDLGRLVMVDNPRHNPDGDFALVDGRLRSAGAPRLTYAGIALLAPALFAGLTDGRRALAPVYRRAMDADRLSGQHWRGWWTDAGTPARLAAAERHLRARDTAPPAAG